ncbi:MAG TPA: pitrilysin family protein [Vicinamibacterales bacterium]|nr:pitrilysin family protein [Vicinamibacterales bacterium]
MKSRVAAIVLVLALPGAALAQTKWPSERPPGALPARAVPFPPYEIRTLPNGLQVVAVLRHEQPLVSMRLIVRAGSALDPRDKPGVARLVASLLDQGTVSMTAPQLNDAIDFVGGDMSTGADADLSFVRIIVMKDSFDFGLQLLSDMTRLPTFSPQEVERQRQRMQSVLDVQSQDARSIADEAFSRIVYGPHPYGLPHGGTPTSLATIERDDLAAFHDKYFVPNNALLAVVGDLSADEAFDAVNRVFGGWRQGDVPAPAFPAPPSPARRVVVIDKPDAVQTEIRVGHIGVKRNTSDYMALNLALRILGGEGANRLHQVLRNEHSLAYSAQAIMDAKRDAGDFEAETSTRTDATGEAVRLIIDEFWRLQRERVSEQELTDAKSFLVGSFPLTIERPDAIATQVLDKLLFGLPVQELQSLRDRVNAVTVDDIERVSRYYLNPDRLSIVLVGNAAKFTPQLKRAGLGNFETIEAPQLDLGAPDLKVRKSAPAYLAQQGVVPQPPDVADALLQRVIQAKGGLDRLRGVKSLSAVTEAESDTPNGRTTAETTTYLEYPNHVRVETKTPAGVIVQAYDGARAWIRDPRGVHDVPNEMVQQLDAGFARDVIALLIDAQARRVRTRALPDVKADDGRTYHVLECSSPALEPTILYIDPVTYLVARQSYVAGGPGQPIVEESFTDYRDVDGIKLSFAAAVRQGGQPVAERRVTSIRLNAPIDPALFRRPVS